MSGNLQALAVAQRIHAATLANAQVVHEKVTNDVYKSEWKRYRDFVEKSRAEGKLQPGEKYLTRDNVDFYFGEKVAYREVVADSARRVVSALQWFADHREHQMTEFVVDSPHVKQALEAQKERFADVVEKRVQDPHFQLPTSVLTEADYRKANHAILQKYEWEDLHFSWSVCDATFIRMHSFLNLKLSDLKTDVAHGPPSDTGPGNHRMMSYVLRPGGVHKDRHKYTQVVGNWRHKEYIRCATGSLAMGLMVRFRSDPELININFYGDPQKGRPEWWDIPLPNRWKKTSAADAAYRKILNETDIVWSKVLHLRKSGMDKAGTVGVSQDASASMSKHRSDKINRYIPQLQNEICHAMTGFLPNMEYYPPRIWLLLPWSPHDCVCAIFLQYEKWVKQYNAPQGDHSQAANDFLFETLPFLALVALQDGIYWIRDYPNNTASVMLRNSLPGYEQWAAEARKEVLSKQATLEESRIELLDAATQASFNVLGRKVDLLVEEYRQAHLEHQADRQQLFLLQQQVNAAPFQEQSPLSRSLVSMVPTHRNPIQVSTTANALALLRPSPRVPEIATNWPIRVIDVLLQHETANLNDYVNNKKTHWPAPLRNNFSRRMYLYRQIELRSRNYHADCHKERMRLAALAMDQERGSRTASKFRDALKKVDSNTKKRKPRNGNGNGTAN